MTCKCKSKIGISVDYMLINNLVEVYKIWGNVLKVKILRNGVKVCIVPRRFLKF